MLDNLRARIHNSSFFDLLSSAKNRAFYVYFMLSMATVSDFIAATTSPIQAVQLATAVFCFLWFSLLLFNLYSLRVTTSLQMGSLIACLEETVVCFYSGGVYASAMSWFALIVIANYFIAGRRAGFFWLVVVVLMYVLQLSLHDFFDSVVPLGVQRDQALSSLLDYSFMAIALMLVLLFFDRVHRTAVLDLRARQLELEATQSELEYTLLMREHFIASVSHELRTPMNAIMGFNNLLLSMVRDKPQALMVLDHTRQSADHLLTVINDVLDYTQFKSGQLRARIAPADLYQTIGSAFGLFMPRVENSVCYSCDLPPNLPAWAETDSHRLTQVLVNLLGNAIKFTAAGDVKLTVSALPNDWFEFRVSDTGIGIAEEEQQRLFSSFSQANPSIQARFGGSGLGLMISQRLVHLLGGELSFKSESGRGSEFWFTLHLPAVEPPAVSDVTVPLTPLAGFSKLRFLIVDDHAVNRLVLRQILLSHWPDADIVEGEDGFAALRFIETSTFDLVFLDMVMPNLDGIQTAQRLADSDFPSKPPLIGLTANVNPQDLDAFFKAGLSGLLLKPFNREQLTTLIHQLLSSQASKV